MGRLTDMGVNGGTSARTDGQLARDGRIVEQNLDGEGARPDGLARATGDESDRNGYSGFWVPAPERRVS